MRNRNCTHFFNTLFWFLLYSLPVLLFLGFVVFSRQPLLSLTSFFEVTQLASSSSLVYTTLVDLFGSAGVLPLFDNPVVFQLFSWFASVTIIRLAVTFILFIPRLASKWLDKFTQSED